MVVLEREVFKVFPEDRVPQRLPLSRPSLLIVEVFKVFPVDRVPQRLPLSRLFLRLLIDRNHEPRFMAVMTSGCVWSMLRTTASTTGTGGTTLRAGGCRGESSTAGACSPLATTGFFPLSDQKDSYAVVLVVMDASRAVFFFRVRCAPVPVHRQSGRHSCFMGMDLADPVSSGKYSGAFVFTAPVVEPTVMLFTGPLNGYIIVATLRRQIALALWPQCAAEVFASRCRVVVEVSLVMVLTISFGTA